MRFSYLSESPPTDDVTVPDGYVERLDDEGNDLGPEVPINTASREIGEVSAGLLWGIWGDPTGLQLNVLTALGAGVLTTDSTEYVLVEVAPGVQYTKDDRLQFYASAAYQGRWRKGLAHGPRAMAGVRYLFD